MAMIDILQELIGEKVNVEHPNNSSAIDISLGGRDKNKYKIKAVKDDILVVERIDQWVEYLSIKHIRVIYNYR